jgi:hypothetical protein
VAETGECCIATGVEGSTSIGCCSGAAVGDREEGRCGAELSVVCMDRKWAGGRCYVSEEEISLFSLGISLKD